MLFEINPIASFCDSNIINDSSGNRIGISDLFQRYKISEYYSSTVNNQKAFTEKIKILYKNNFSDKRYHINNIKQYVLLNMKYINEHSVINENYQLDNFD